MHEEIRSTSRSEFLSRYPHPFLIREAVVGSDPGAIAFSTLSASNPSTLERRAVPHTTSPSSASGSMLAVDPRSGPPSSAPRISTRLYSFTHRYEFLLVKKREENPWQDRILLGRAPNNDIILRDASVSKSHAHFSQGPDGAWILVAKKTVNGTIVDGRSIDVGESAPLKSGSALHFGNVHCEFIESGSLFDFFTR